MYLFDGTFPKYKKICNTNSCQFPMVICQVVVCMVYLKNATECSQVANGKAMKDNRLNYLGQLIHKINTMIR